MGEHTCILIKTGLAGYETAYSLQKALLDRKLGGEKNDFLILSEHKPVITLGRGFDEKNLLAAGKELSARGIEVRAVERGGDATYHGPGQLVGYPLLDLSRFGRDLRLFVFSLEEVIIRTLRDFNIDSARKKGSPGVWTSGMKIASIGVAVRKWITYHGFALNISTDLRNFCFINPCGMDYNVMTTVEKVLGEKIPLERAEGKITEHFSAVFGVPVIDNTVGETRNA